MSEIKTLFDEMWRDYIAMTPLAAKVVDLFKAEGESIVNDHIALRTFNLDKVGIDVLAKPFLDAGYTYGGDYHFEQKKLYAKHFEHPDKSLPKVFISELLVEKLSEKAQQLIKKIVSEIKQEVIDSKLFLISGRSWDLLSEDYQYLSSESEYAGWLAALGYRPNHFTLFVNEFKHFNEISEVNEFLTKKGIQLNLAGGAVKGSLEAMLEQSSTLADKVSVTFSDKEMIIPSCYFEFAKRYPMKNGELYQGFVATSADKIFESTNG